MAGKKPSNTKEESYLLSNTLIKTKRFFIRNPYTLKLKKTMLMLK